MKHIINELELTGRSRNHIRQYETPRFAAHPETAAAFSEMRRAAAAEGFDLHPFSAFRDYDSQTRIWNLKFSGERPLYSADGKLIDPSSLKPQERIYRILDWTALPGASRHHWGTDIDVIDRAAIPADGTVRLLPEETRAGGPFHRLHVWLDAHMDRFGFFRPYSRYQKGIFPEPWHLSFGFLSRPALQALSLEMVQAAISSGDLLGKQMVLEMLPEIFQRYILNINDQPDGSFGHHLVRSNRPNSGCLRIRLGFGWQ